jgi:nucleoporin NUP1
MHEKDDRSRLGIPGKKKSKKAMVNGTKPYAGEGGMKKLLARRKMEEEEEKAKASTVEDDDGEIGEEQKSRSHAGGMKESHEPEMKESQRPPVPDRRSNSVPGREQSSLRVGRTKISRSHVARPTARPLNRFSARYADDEGDDQMQEDGGKNDDQLNLEEAAKNVPVFEIPAGFTFAKEVGIYSLQNLLASPDSS